MHRLTDNSGFIPSQHIINKLLKMRSIFRFAYVTMPLWEMSDTIDVAIEMRRARCYARGMFRYLTFDVTWRFRSNMPGTQIYLWWYVRRWYFKGKLSERNICNIIPAYLYALTPWFLNFAVIFRWILYDWRGCHCQVFGFLSFPLQCRSIKLNNTDIW